MMRSLKGQSTICAGGRYDNLVEHLGGPKTPGYGFAAGLERLILITKGGGFGKISLMLLSNQPEIFILESNLYKESHEKGFKLNIELNYNPTNISKQIESALKKNIDYMLFYLDDEKQTQKITIKNLHTKTETKCSLNPKDIIDSIIKSHQNIKA